MKHTVADRYAQKDSKFSLKKKKNTYCILAFGKSCQSGFWNLATIFFDELLNWVKCLTSEMFNGKFETILRSCLPINAFVKVIQIATL